MLWMEWIVHTTTEAAELVAEIMMQEGAKGTSVEDRNDFFHRGESAQWDVVDPDFLDTLPEDVLVHGYFSLEDDGEANIVRGQGRLEALLREDLGYDLGSLAGESRQVDDTDWAEHWKQYYKPFRAGESLVVKPTWELYEALPGDRVIEIDPGMAFGTGTHETTAMCLGLLEKWQKPGSRVMDVGCGSGILAIAAALLGAERVVAVDIDPVAVRVAKENIAQNGLESKVHAMEGDLLAGIQETADVMVANIVANVIILLAGPAREHIQPGGLLICSGIIRDRVEEVREALTSVGFVLLEEQVRGEWVALVARS